MPGYIREALARGLGSRLPALLTNYRLAKEAEIEALCQKYYNGEQPNSLVGDALSQLDFAATGLR